MKMNPATEEEAKEWSTRTMSSDSTTDAYQQKYVSPPSDDAVTTFLQRDADQKDVQQDRTRVKKNASV